MKNLYQRVSTKVEFTNDGKAISKKQRKGQKKKVPVQINEVSSSEEEDYV